MLSFIQNAGPWQILIILLVVVLLFGSKKLPELFGSLGKSVSEFKKGKEEGMRELEQMKADLDTETAGSETKQEETTS